jgi:hypothetical protein
MDPYLTIAEALTEAIQIMTKMTVNQGQKTVLDDYFIPQFEQNATADPESGWNPVDPQPYQDFMSIIIEAGNQIMAEAYRIALAAQRIRQLF